MDILIPQPVLETRYPANTGLFALIAWLYCRQQQPVVLPAETLRAYDPALSDEAIVQAVQFLESRLVLTTHLCASGTAFVPDMADVPIAGALDSTIFELGLGRITVDPQGDAQIERLTSAPLLTLADVGSYAAGIATPALMQWQFFHPLNAGHILATVSQGVMFDAHAITLTMAGYAYLGIPVRPRQQPGGSEAV